MTVDQEKLYATDKADVWAAEWIKAARKIWGRRYDVADLLDEGWMIGWFANAIETAKTLERRRILDENVPEKGEWPMSSQWGDVSHRPAEPPERYITMADKFVEELKRANFSPEVIAAAEKARDELNNRNWRPSYTVDGGGVVEG
jgi:hypothetical protein